MSVDPSICSIDLPRPFACGERHTVGQFGYEYDRVCQADQQAAFGRRTEGGIYVLYCDGSESDLSSMNDVLTGIKTPWTIAEAMKSPQRAEWLEALFKTRDASAC